MKKKLSMLAAMALCVTVGGVYATWIYATDTVDTAKANMSITLTGTAGGGDAGTLTIAGTNVDLTIDDTNDGTVHNAALVWNTNGYFTITFTPNANAEENVKDGVDLQWYIGLYDTTTGSTLDATSFEFEMKDGAQGDVFTTFDTEPVTISVDDMDKTTTPGSFIYELDIDTVMSKMTLNTNLYLTTMEQYEAFESLITGKMIHVHVKVAANQVAAE